MRRVIKVIILIVMIGMLAYGGLCVYANCIAKDPTRLEMPTEEEAPYSFLVENTGTLILTDEYEQFGDTAGSRKYILHGYWEMVGMEFQYRESDIILQEQVFGEITVRQR